MNLCTSFLCILLSFSSAWAALTPVTDNDWGLKIVIFAVGQGDGTLLLTRNGQAVIIDMGETKTHGQMIADYLLDAAKNGVATIDTVEYLFATHYDSDHIGGARGLAGKIKAKVAYDQGPSAARSTANAKGVYTAYTAYVGDKNGNGIKDAGETHFIRHKAQFGDEFKIGQNKEVVIRVLSVRGDTAGTANDLPLAPVTVDFDENPGSIIQLVTLNEFEYLTTGDATSDDWKSKPDSEEALIHANAIPGGHDIDVLKVSHHGSDTSSGQLFVQSIRPELAIISSDYKAVHKLPKLTSIKVLEMNNATVWVTGRAGKNPGTFNQSSHSFDDGYVPTRTTDRLGTITILVAADGSKYTARCEKNPQLSRTFSSKDP